MKDKKIGFIGMGLMGSRMAARLMAYNYKLEVYNRSPAKCESLKKSGAIVSKSVHELARNSEIVFTMLSDPGAVTSTALGSMGLLENMKPGSLWIDCSTVNPTFTIEMAQEAKKRNIRFIDAPVAGSIIPAEKGELVFLLGGAKNDVEEMLPLFEIMGKKWVHLGDNGKGTSMKMVINTLLGNTMVAYAEALALGKSLGLDTDLMGRTLTGGPVAAPFLAAKQNKINDNDYSAEFPLTHIQKDLMLAATEAYINKQALPVTNASKELYALAKQKGLGNMDFSAIYKFLRE
jgi:3-hydroxyisobutyrate dehydrogenase-like beta-hydroxyacid dehydrogenase